MPHRTGGGTKVTAPYFSVGQPHASSMTTSSTGAISYEINAPVQYFSCGQMPALLTYKIIMAHTYAGTEDRSRDDSKGASKYLIPALIAAAILGLVAWATSNNDVRTDTTTQDMNSATLNGTQ